MRKFQIKKGFTLLEILVVIGIIVVLIGMGTVSYSTAQKKARDAKRKGDLQAFQKVLEQCYSISNYSYPTISGNGTTSISANCTAQGGPSLTITDPTTKTYTVSSSTTTYSVTISLEEGGTFPISNQQ
jgi:prepilin-type N-terminal cleavage/methylation domain-containing protein